MQLILTHEKTDFDALASQLGAWKLYPQAQPVLPRHMNRNLCAFLTLYSGELPYLRYEDLPRREVERIILVDTQTLVTPKGMTENTTVQIIDHHPLGRELPPNWTYAGEAVGATATMFVERIIAERIPLAPIEATLLALGIYEDTGSLSYPSTTVRDLRCATWLVEQGAYIPVIHEFLHHPLTDRQLKLYETLLDSTQVFEFAGHSVVVATATARGEVEEISTLAHKIRDLYDPAGLFLLVDLGEHLQLVARSTTDSVDVGRIAGHFGGGGHTRAAAALIRNMSLGTAREQLLALLERQIQPATNVAQIMSHGVHTLSPETTVDEAAEAMGRYGFEGFPVVDRTGQVLGILSRREIDRAQRLRLGDMAVSHYMTKGNIHILPNEPVERLQQIMMQSGVGQVPVMSNGEIVGVVTRTDLIKLWAAPTRQPLSRPDIAAKLEAALPPPLLGLLHQASTLAQEMGVPLYIVGGFVRDLLLDKPTLDMDLVVEGDAVRLARRLARSIGARTRSHARFGTAKIILEGLETDFGVPALDFATARLEFYAHSAALPEVERSSIKADLHRRDFTINTLAIRVDSEHYGRLLDFYGGEQDLREGLIRALHSLSFIEDPTRMLRAARFEQRLGFVIEARTAELIDTALPMLSRVTGERIRHELYLILSEREPEKALCRLDCLKVLAQIHPRLACPEETRERFARLRTIIAGRQWDIPAEGNGLVSPELYLALLTDQWPRDDVEALARHLKFYRADLLLLRQVLDLREREGHLDQPILSNREIDALLRHTTSHGRLVYWLCSGSQRVRDRLWLYETELRHVQPILDGAYLKSLGLKPSPLFGKLLQSVREARLDGQIQSEEQERALVSQLLEQWKEA